MVSSSPIHHVAIIKVVCIAFVFCDNQVIRYVFGEKQMEGRKRDELTQLQEEQSQLNVKEEFPKYARIERKINKIKDDMKKLSEFLILY